MLLLGLLLSVCAITGDYVGKGTTTKQVQPTWEPPPAKGPPSPLGDVIRVVAGGYALRPHAGYVVTTVGNKTDMTAAGGNLLTGPTVSVYKHDWHPNLTLEMMVANFEASFKGGLLVTDLATVRVNGRDGVTATFAGNVGHGAVGGRITGLAAETHSVWIIGLAEPAAFEARYSAEYNAMLQTLILFQQIGME